MMLTRTVISFNVIKHLTEPGFFLSECNRILKKGGSLCLLVPFLWHIHGNHTISIDTQIMDCSTF